MNSPSSVSLPLLSKVMVIALIIYLLNDLVIGSNKDIKLHGGLSFGQIERKSVDLKKVLCYKVIKAMYITLRNSMNLQENN